MARKIVTTSTGQGPSPKQLERMKDAIRASEVAKAVSQLSPARPAETFGKIRDERAKDNRVISSPQ